MVNYCKLTGCENPETTEAPFKKMCLNCVDCSLNADENCVCTNVKVMEAGKQKILAAVPEGFEIEEIKLKPMLLKNPTKKCGFYSADYELIHAEVDKFFA